MATIYDALRLLAAYGWKTWYQIGNTRVLVHPARPGVRITLAGLPSVALLPEALEQILRHAGLDEEV